MNDPARPNPMSAAGTVSSSGSGVPPRKIPKPPQPMRSSIPPLPKEEKKVDTSEAVSILKEAAQETSKPAKVAKIKVPQPAKIDAKAVERLDQADEPKKEEVIAEKKSAPLDSAKKTIPKSGGVETKPAKSGVDKPPSKISDRVPEKVVKMSTAKVSAMAPKKADDEDLVKKRTARVTLKSTPAAPAKPVEKVSEVKKAAPETEVLKTDLVKPKPTQKEPAKAEKAPVPKPGVTLEEQSKRPWWKFWGKAPEIAVDSKADELIEGAERPLTEEELVHKRHEALIDSVNQICHSLEATSARPIEVKTSDLVPLIPGDDINALNRTQELVSGVLKQVSGRLEQAGERDAVMINSLSSMDKSITSLNNVGERTITTMDGMKGILSQVSGAMTTMQTELKESSKRYEELCVKVQKTESENMAKVEKLQKSSLWINVILGLAVVGGLIAVAISKAG